MGDDESVGAVCASVTRFHSCRTVVLRVSLSTRGCHCSVSCEG